MGFAGIGGKSPAQKVSQYVPESQQLQKTWRIKLQRYVTRSALPGFVGISFFVDPIEPKQRENLWCPQRENLLHPVAMSHTILEFWGDTRGSG